MTRIRASATCEPVNGHDPKHWRVTVTGEAPYQRTKVYDMHGSENEAAFGAIDRFVAENERLGPVLASGLGPTGPQGPVG